MNDNSNQLLTIATEKLYWILTFLWFVPLATCSSQVVLYMEQMTEVKPIKYYEGQTLSYKSKEYPNEWNQIKIERILDKEKIILFDGGLLKLDEITHIRRSRTFARALSYALETFGTAWLVYGAIAHFTTDTFSFGTDTAVIGGTALASGWLINKLFKWKHYKIGSKVRLKILDISWPEPVGQ